MVVLLLYPSRVEACATSASVGRDWNENYHAPNARVERHALAPLDPSIDRHHSFETRGPRVSSAIPINRRDRSAGEEGGRLGGTLMAFQPTPPNRDGRRGDPCGMLLEHAGALGGKVWGQWGGINSVSW